MRWTVHGERVLYHSPWVNLHLVDVEIPGGPRFEHHAVRMPFAAAGTVPFDPDRGVLLLYRHRFIGDAWGWEIPAGAVDAGESHADAARRECREEVGWEPRTLRHLTTYNYASGLSDGQFALFLGTDLVDCGAPTDHGESERLAWFTPIEVRELLTTGQVVDGLTLTGLLWATTFGLLQG